MKKKIIITMLCLLLTGLFIFALIYIKDAYKIIRDDAYSGCYSERYVYTSVADLDAKADYVFEGVITDVNFTLINNDLHTIYTVKPYTVYKGDKQETYQVIYYGGVKGYKPTKQAVLLKIAGKDYRYIGSNFKIGEVILFTTKKLGFYHNTILDFYLTKERRLTDLENFGYAEIRAYYD